ncbi:MAG: RNA polymerase sigma factor [Clostridia bacterium]|nr:RNA polymerase sigma factor [Clostridia bacterium]
MQDSDIELYHRFLDGDEQGLEQLISLYQHALLRFIYGYVRDVGLAEDVLTDVFLTLYYKRSFKEKDGVALKTYVFKIARNKALNVLKKRLRRKELSLESLTQDGNFALEDPVANASPHDALETVERNQALYAALAKLKKEYRETLYLRFFQNLSPEEIAKITNKNVKQVYNLLSRGKNALKEELLSGGFPYEIV